MSIRIVTMRVLGAFVNWSVLRFRAFLATIEAIVPPVHLQSFMCEFFLEGGWVGWVIVALFITGWLI